jgi:hypothetical protein
MNSRVDKHAYAHPLRQSHVHRIRSAHLSSIKQNLQKSMSLLLSCTAAHLLVAGPPVNCRFKAAGQKALPADGLTHYTERNLSPPPIAILTGRWLCATTCARADETLLASSPPLQSTASQRARQLAGYRTPNQLPFGPFKLF